MLKQISLLVSLCAFSLSATVTVVNNTDQNFDVYPGSQGWNPKPTPIKVKANKTTTTGDWGFGGAVIKNNTIGELGPVYTAPGKETWSYNNIKITIFKDANKKVQVKVEPM
jgi:hypothetical protein